MLEKIMFVIFFRNNMRANNNNSGADTTPQYETEYNLPSQTQQYVQVEMPSPEDQQFVIYTS
jgi:hypothetical protein